MDARISWWLAYADFCINAESELARCQPFWAFVSGILGVIFLAVLASVVAKTILDRRKGAQGRDGTYRKH